MKNIISLILAVCCLLISQKTIAQTNISFKLAHQFNGAIAQEGQVYSLQGAAFSYERIQYYLSNFVITHDEGQVTELGDLVFLVDSDHGSTFDLGSHPIYHVEHIEFSVGVPEHLNHLDPSTYELNHPLAHHNPSMHWGWTSGYRFLCLDAHSALDIVQIHALGDANYYSQTHEVNQSSNTASAIEINFDANYDQILTDVSVIGGVFEHSETTPTIVQALENMQNLVFSYSVASTDDPLDQPSINIYPNPATSFIEVEGAQPGDIIKVIDVNGRVALSEVFVSSTLDVSDIEAGAYTVVVEGVSNKPSRLLIVR